MSNWKQDSLTKHVSLVTKGTTPTSIGKQFQDNGINFIKAESITDAGMFISSAFAYIDESTHEILKRSQLQNGDILFSIAGVLGRVAVVNRDILPANTNQAIAIIRLSSNSEIEKDFLKHLLNSEFVKEQIRRINVQAAQANFSLADINRLQIQYPKEPNEQSNIARILSTADAVIEKTQAAIAKYKAIKQGMLQDLFTRGIDVNTNKLRPRFEDAPELYKESKLGMIPREWDVDVMDTYVSFLRSGLSRLLSDEDIGIPVMISGNIQESRFDFSNLKYWYIDDPQGADTNSYKLTIGDILICFINSLDQIGKSAIFEGFKRDVIYTTNLLRMQASKNTNSRFLFYLLNSSITQNELHTIVKPAVNQASFTTKDFLKIPVPLVPETEQNVMAEKLTTIDKTIDAEQTYLQKMQNLKKGLMEDLLSGRKQVKINEATTV